MKAFYILSEFCFMIMFVSLSSCLKKDEPPTINDQEFSIEEYSQSGFLVGNVAASDPDGKISSYSILSGNINNAFSISDSGKLVVSNEDAIDYNINPSFKLVVEVKDNTNRTARANIIVNLIKLYPPTDGLILYYPFNGNLKDSSGYNNDGIDYTSDKYVQGKKGRALDFNGTSDYIQLSSSIDPTNGLSLSFWLSTRGANGIQNNGTIVSKYNMSGLARCLLINSFGSGATRNVNRLAVAFYADGSSSDVDAVFSYMDANDLANYSNPSLWSILNPEYLTLGTWTHCVVNATPTKIEIWINDVLCTTKTREYSSYFNTFTEPTTIGNLLNGGDGSNNHFNGTLDEFRIYNRELTEKEIKILFKE
ncbi:MAG: LamG-like jellyroll fold domain-containing protein [Bacteroidales bacterium]|jgi:hypothetical protein